MADDKLAHDEDNRSANHTQPGSVIAPGDDNNPAPQHVDQKPVEVQQVEEPQIADLNQQPEINKEKFTAETDGHENDQSNSLDVLSWSAPEFISHEKSMLWYISLMAAALILSVLFFVITKDIVTVAVVIVGALLFGIYGSRKPKEIDYKLDSRLIIIGDKQYFYSDFRTFTSAREANLSSVTFTPLKRFSAPLSIYFDNKNEDMVLNLISSHIPFEQHKPDAIEALMRRIHF